MKPRPWSGQNPKCPSCGSKCEGQIVAFGYTTDTGTSVYDASAIRYALGRAGLRNGCLIRICEACSAVWPEWPKDHIYPEKPHA